MKKYLALIILFISQLNATEIISPAESERVLEPGDITVTWSQDNPGDSYTLYMGRNGEAQANVGTTTNTTLTTAFWQWGPDYILIWVRNNTTGIASSYRRFYYNTSPTIWELNLTSGDTIDNNYSIDWIQFNQTFNIEVRNSSDEIIHSETAITPPLNTAFMTGNADGEYEITISHQYTGISADGWLPVAKTLNFTYQEDATSEPPISEPSTDQIDFTALIAWQETIHGDLNNIEYYTAVLAVACCLGLGLIIWRLIMLSKNQREIF